jgi:hypothetical protein
VTELDRLDKARALVEAVAAVEAEWVATSLALAPVVSVFVQVAGQWFRIRQESLVFLSTVLNAEQK